MNDTILTKEGGIYAIYSIYPSGEQELIYIGKTYRPFEQRFLEHKTN